MEQPVNKCRGTWVVALPGSGEMEWQCPCGNGRYSCELQLQYSHEKTQYQEHQQQEAALTAQMQVFEGTDNQKQVAARLGRLRATVEQSNQTAVTNTGIQTMLLQLIDVVEQINKRIKE